MELIYILAGVQAGIDILILLVFIIFSGRITFLSRMLSTLISKEIDREIKEHKGDMICVKDLQ